MLIPAIAFDPVARGAVKLPIRLLTAVTVVPSEIRSPATALPALLPFRSEILFPEIVVVAPDDEIAVTEPAPEWLLIMLVLTLADALESIAVNAPVPESVPVMMLFAAILGVPLAALLTMPDQAPAPEVNDEQF